MTTAVRDAPLGRASAALPGSFEPSTSETPDRANLARSVAGADESRRLDTVNAAPISSPASEPCRQADRCDVGGARRPRAPPSAACTDRRSTYERARRRRQARGRGQALRRGRGRGPHQPGGPDRRVLQPARTVRVRKDHHPPDDRRVRGTHLGAHRAQGPGRDLAAALQAPRQHRLPELRAVPAPQRLRERRLRAPAQRRQGGRGPQPRHRDAQAGRAARLRVPQAEPGLGRAGAARRARAGLDQPPVGAAPGRAARRPRPQAPQADAGRAQADPAGSGHHLHLRDPRPGRSDDDVRSHRGDEPRQVRAAGRPRQPVREAADPVRRELPRRQQPARGEGRRHRRRVHDRPDGRRHPDPGAERPRRGVRRVRGRRPPREDQAVRADRPGPRRRQPAARA